MKVYLGFYGDIFIVLWVFVGFCGEMFNLLRENCWRNLLILLFIILLFFLIFFDKIWGENVMEYRMCLK